MLSFANVSIVLLVILLLYLYFKISRMARAGSPLFKIGYCLYSKTRIGYLYYRRELTKARQKFHGEPHSKVEPVEFNGIKITPIPMSMDNYGYMITEDSSDAVVLIDPADVDSVQAVLDKENCKPTAILTTHKHWDHSGGNKYFRSKYPGMCIYGCALDGVPDATNYVSDGEDLIVGQGHMRFKVMYTPGHTVGHVVFRLNGTPYDAPDSLFSGDEVFLGGCGRMFECNPNTMLQSLDRISSLPGETLLWPGHEYAKENLEFALTVEPDNAKLQEKYEWVKEKRKDLMASCPSTIFEETEYNPFLRTNQETLLQTLGFTDIADHERQAVRAKALLELRTRKDKYKYKL